jgi:hypothetical protein
MTKLLFAKCLSLIVAVVMLTAFHPTSAGATETPGETVTCPDGNIYVCATMGNYVALKGKGVTVIVVTP